MRIFEIADAEAQLALWKLVNDSVWTEVDPGVRTDLMAV